MSTAATGTMESSASPPHPIQTKGYDDDGGTQVTVTPTVTKIKLRKWEDEPLIRLGGCFGTAEPIQISRTFLMTNPNWIFYNMFSGRMGEPRHEWRLSKVAGKQVKVYLLDIPDNGLHVLFGFMSQYQVGYITNEQDIKTTFESCKELSNNMTLVAWKAILTYYGFLPLDIVHPTGTLNTKVADLMNTPTQSRSTLSLTKLSPPLRVYKQSLEALFEHVLSKSPDWHNFSLGIVNTITFCFAAKYLSDFTIDEHTMFVRPAPGMEPIPAVWLLLKDVGHGIGNYVGYRDTTRIVLLHQMLAQIHAPLTHCDVDLTYSTNSTALKWRRVKGWPAAHCYPPYDPTLEASRTALAPILAKEYVLGEEYTIVTLILKWR